MTLDRKEIEKEAKQILEKFAKALEEVEKEKDIDSYVDREEFERNEKRGEDCDKDNSFKQRFLKNVPEHDEDFVLVEKRGWK